MRPDLGARPAPAGTAQAMLHDRVGGAWRKTFSLS